MKAAPDPLTHKWLTHVLTGTKLRTLKPRASEFRRYRYRYAGEPSIIIIAEYPATRLAEARAERERLRVLVRGGGNPAQAAKIERAAMVKRAGTTFGWIATELLDKREHQLALAVRDPLWPAYDRKSHPHEPKKDAGLI